jgi:tRNA pseudouridine38-40 synthase
MRTLKLQIQYLGTRYDGWQVQPHRPTIQGHLERVLRELLGEQVKVAGAGRTDAGVHARGQVASLTTGSSIPSQGILRAANSRLPEDIRLLSVEEAPEGFHARHDVLAKEYVYRFSCVPILSPFLAPTVESIRATLAIEPMNEAAECFLGEHDFAAFCGPEGRLKNTRREVTLSRITAEPDEVWGYTIRARGFLQHMVRTIMGTLLEVGRRRITPSEIPEILATRDRRRAGPTCSPRGLTLERIEYPERSEILATPGGV